MHRPPIGADPLAGQTIPMGSTDVPGFGMKRGGPGTPRLGSVEDSPTAAMVETCRQQVTFDPGIVHCVDALKMTRVAEDNSALLDAAGPDRLMGRIQLHEELVGAAVADSLLRYAGQNDVVVRLVGARSVLGIDVDVIVTRSTIVLSEIAKRRRAKTGFEFVFPMPGVAVVFRPEQLRIADVSHPHVQHAIYHQDSAGLGSRLAIAEPFTAG